MTQSPDVIFVERMQFFGFHGVHPEERKLGQRFEVDLRLETSTRQAGISDDLAETVSYSEAFRRVKSIVEGPSRQLIETVAEEIATTLLTENARVSAVTVTFRKPDAPIKNGFFGAVGVTIRREREGEME